MLALLLAVALAGPPTPDRADITRAAQTRWPLLDTSMEQVVIQHRSELDPATRRIWALDRALPMLAGEINASDAVLKEVLTEVTQSASKKPVSSDLARLEQARQDYASRALQKAAQRYGTIGQESSLWPDALRERAWTLLLLGRPDDALGATVSLLAPYFAREDHAEGRLMKATVFLQRCRYDEARSEVAALADAPQDALAVGDPRTILMSNEAPTSPAVRLAWASPLVVRARLALHETRSPSDRMRLEALGVRLFQEALAGEAEVQRDARERALKIRYESFRQQRALLENNRAPHKPEPAKLPDLDDDEVEWTFDGTFWRDELGSYRYTAADACPHEAQP